MLFGFGAQQLMDPEGFLTAAFCYNCGQRLHFERALKGVKPALEAPPAPTKPKSFRLTRLY
jgi:hypothetical protein